MHIYFSGIAGSGLAPLALIAHQAGYKVSGSDAKDSIFLDDVKKEPISISFDQSSEEIARIHEECPIDWVIYTSALPTDHVHLTFAREHNIKVSKRDEFINYIVSQHNQKLIAVAGTHGKTTTTAMLTWLFKQTSTPVSHLIGSNTSFGPAGRFNQDAEYFVFECDEFDRNFLSFSPYLSIITNCNYDHPDTYASEQEYISSFKTFASQTEVICAYSETISKLGYTKDIEEFTSDDGDDGLLLGGWLDSHGNDGDIVEAEKSDEQYVSLIGLHNRTNAVLAASAFCELFLDQDYSDILEGVSSFPGTAKRFEVLHPYCISDYAHHPDEITATLQLAKEYKEKLNSSGKIVVLYQPHQNRRQHEDGVQNAYPTSFIDADLIYWLPTFLAREDDSQSILTPEELIAVAKVEDKAQVADFTTELEVLLQNHISNGDIIVGMGAGSIDAWLRGFIHTINR